MEQRMYLEYLTGAVPQVMASDLHNPDELQKSLKLQKYKE
jgi:hypothetical protein